MSNKTNYHAPSRLTLFRWRVVSWSLTMLIQLIFAFFSLIKWLFAPIALFLIIFVGIPFARFWLKLPVLTNFHLVEEDNIPDSVWLEFQQSKLTFLKQGFTPGQYLKVNNITKNMERLILHC